MTNVKVVQQIDRQTGQKQYVPAIATRDIKRKLEMCPEAMDAPANEMLEVGNFLYTAQ